MTGLRTDRADTRRRLGIAAGLAALALLAGCSSPWPGSDADSPASGSAPASGEAEVPAEAPPSGASAPPSAPGAPAPTDPVTPPTWSPDPLAQGGVDALNTARTTAGARPLAPHEGLTALAQAQADSYAQGAQTWDGDLGEQLAQLGFATGSGLARTAQDPADAAAQWLLEPESLGVVTDATVSSVGLASAPLPDGRPMVVVVLAYRADDGSIPPGSQGGDEALDLTNAERAAFGLPALTRSADLDRAAQVQADHQAAIGEMTHDGNGGLGERLAAVGYRTGAENVAVGQRSVAEVVQGWIASPGHHANIVHEDMTEAGFAVAFGADGRAYWAQTFGDR